MYTGGKEREKLHFNYGVFLLNKNIAQMRWYCGIPTPDLRPTLANLHFLLAKLSQPRWVLGVHWLLLLPGVYVCVCVCVFMKIASFIVFCGIDKKLCVVCV